MIPTTLPSNLNAILAPKPGSEEYRKQLTEVTEKIVAQTFFGTLLKQMRDSPLKSELFSGGRGGAAFGSLYDQHLAERMSRGAGGKLVNAIVKRFEGKRAYEQQAKQSKLTRNAK